MVPIRDERKRKFCKDVLDVEYIEYVSGWHIIRRTIGLEQQYVDLELLYRFNDDLEKNSKKNSKEPYVQILANDEGTRYARLSDEETEYAFNNDLSFIPECKERDKRNVPLREAVSKLVDNSLEERICEKCGNVLGLDCSKMEFLSTIYGMVNKNIRRATPWADVFLKSTDFPGSYLN
jgi:hypothetical protein